MEDDPDSLIFKPITQNDRFFLSLLLKNQKIAENFIKGSQYIDQEIDDILASMIDFLTNNSLGFYVVYEGSNQIGIAGFNYLKEFDEVEVVYCVDEKYWGNGYASRILSRLIEIGVKEHNLIKIYGIVKECNHASFRVLKKNGFKEKTLLKENGQSYICLELDNLKGKKKVYQKAREVGL